MKKTILVVFLLLMTAVFIGPVSSSGIHSKKLPDLVVSKMKVDDSHI